MAEFVSVRLHFDCADQGLEACEVNLVLQCLNNALQVREFSFLQQDGFDFGLVGLSVESLRHTLFVGFLI